jgi:hypothetical protein
MGRSFKLGTSSLIVAFSTFSAVFAAVFTPACSSSQEADGETEGAASVRACAGPYNIDCPPGWMCHLSNDDPDSMGECFQKADYAQVPEWDRCSRDSDCIAVPRGGCCQDGWKEAVNKNKVIQYTNQFDDLVCTAFCPAIVIRDDRAALCNSDKGRCEMVENRDIACNGSSPNPHHCPTGYTCQGAGMPTGAPGHCVSNVPIPNDGCGGCPTGQWCSFCFGSMACIPIGAKC